MKKILSLLLILVPFGFALSATTTISQSASYIPRVYLRGDAGSNEVGRADILASIWQGVNSNLFVYGQGFYGHAKQTWEKNPWTASMGLGYRQVVANNVILGAYVLGDYVKTVTDHSIKQVSPGIEVLGKIWDFRANGYFPVGKKKWQKSGWADTFGDYSHISFHGHDQYDAWYVYSEESGPGADAEVGRKLFNVKNVLVKAYINSYFFYMSQHNDIKGLGARITIQPNTYLEFSLNDSYDNYARNVFTAGVRFSFYDLFSGHNTTINNSNLHWRLFTPLERDFGELGSGDSARLTGGAQDGGDAEQPIPPDEWYGHTTPEKTNVWFFEQGTLFSTKTKYVIGGDGTYEHPYISPQFTQATVDNINVTAPGASLYFSTGTYNAYTSGTPYQPIILRAGQSMWGRMGAYKGYQDPAVGAARSTFIGSLSLESNTEVDSIIVKNDYAMTNFNNGVRLNGATNVLLHNDLIGTLQSNTSYENSVRLDNASSLTLANSEVYSYIDRYTGAPFSYTNGVLMRNGSSLNVTNSKIYAYNDFNYRYATADGIAIQQYGDVINIDHSEITGESLYGYAAGISASNPTGIINIDNISNSHIVAEGVALGYGIYVLNDPKNINIGNISHTSFLGTATGGGGYGNGAFIGLQGTGSATVGNISASTFNGTGGGYGAGFYIATDINNGTVTMGKISNSTFTGTSNVFTPNSVAFYTSALTVEGNPYNGASALENYLLANGNTINGAVYVKTTP